MEDLISILDDLPTQSKRTRGRSLERLTECLCRLLHLAPVRWLARGSRPGSTEALMLAQEERLLRDRWLLQCIDAEHVSMDTIATAVGRGILDSPHYLLVVTSGYISSQAREYAIITSQSCHLPGFTIMLLDGEDLRTLARNATTIEDLIRRELDQNAAQLSRPRYSFLEVRHVL